MMLVAASLAREDSLGKQALTPQSYEAALLAPFGPTASI